MNPGTAMAARKRDNGDYDHDFHESEARALLVAIIGHQLAARSDRFLAGLVIPRYPEDGRLY